MKSTKALSILIAILSIGSCKKDHPNPPVNQPEPLKINSFAPTKAAKDSIITITGKGFGKSPNQNIVTINDMPATVLSATSDALTVKVPIHAGTGVLHVQVGGQGAGSTTIFQYLYTVTTLAGNGYLGYKDGPGSEAQFDFPAGLAIDNTGNVLVADALNNRIRKITPDGQVSTWAGDGSATLKDGNGKAAAFDGLAGIAKMPGGDFLVADSYNNRIRKVTAAADVSTLAEEFADPFGVAADAAGNIYVANTDSGNIRKITPTGIVTTLAAGFNNPSSLVVDEAGYIYVVDKNNHRIRRISPNGDVQTLAGDGTPGFKDDAGPTAKFNVPFGIAAGAHGHLFVTDVDNNSIREITPTGLVITIAGNGQTGFKDGVGSGATFRFPYGIAVDAAGTIYIGDAGNSSIRKLE